MNWLTIAQFKKKASSQQNLCSEDNTTKDAIHVYSTQVLEWVLKLYQNILALSDRI